ncbi:hypothetical protein TYRP_009128 [Tyrophagus putrescentiae]|nr:hypothetical protein TYRP_009128 [Tyrophagus putrescentiae]
MGVYSTTYKLNLSLELTSKNSQAKNRVGKIKNGTKCRQNGNHLTGNGVHKNDTDDEANEAKNTIVNCTTSSFTEKVFVRAFSSLLAIDAVETRLEPGAEGSGLA